MKLLPRDRRVVIFYVLFVSILCSFGNELRLISENLNSKIYSNFIFSFVNLHNSGSAFGFMKEYQYFLIIFAFTAILLTSLYVYKFIVYENKIELFCATLLSGGTLGNLIERIHFGCVTDYIQLNFINFPVFNVFDIMICTSVTLYFIFILFDINFVKKLIYFRKKKNDN